VVIYIYNALALPEQATPAAELVHTEPAMR